MIGRASLVAFAVVTAVNAAILVGVARDPSGGPESHVWVDERELKLEPARENSAVTLRWRLQQAPRRGAMLADPAPWLDTDTLTSLGFDCSVRPGDPAAPEFYSRQLPRRAVVVFALAAEEWDQRLALWQQRAYERLERSPGIPDEHARATLRTTIDEVADRASRLVPVAAGLDSDALRRRYPDRQRHLLVAAVVRVTYDPGARAGGPAVGGRIVELLSPTIQVPGRLTVVFAGLDEDPAGVETRRFYGGDVLAGLTLIEHRPRYRVKVGFSTMGRPRIEGAERLP